MLGIVPSVQIHIALFKIYNSVRQYYHLHFADEKTITERSNNLFPVTNLASCQDWNLNPGSLALTSVSLTTTLTALAYECLYH